MFKKLVILLGVIVVGLVIAVSMVDLNEYKPKIEKAVKDASGYDLKIDGKIGVSLSPIGVSIRKVSVTNPKKGTFAKLGSFDIAVELMPLLKKEIKINYVTLSDLDLNIKKLKNGKFNYEVAGQKNSTKKVTKAENKKDTKLPLINVTEVRLRNANVTYSDVKTKSIAKLKNINIVINDIELNPAKKKLQSIAFRGKVKIDKITYDKYIIDNTNLTFAMKNAIADISSMSYSIFNSDASGKARVDLNGKNPKIRFEQKIKNLKLVNFSKIVLNRDLFDGETNADVKLSFVAGDLNLIKKTLAGNMLLDGQKVTLKGYDLDKIAKTYNSAKDAKNMKKANLGAILTNVANANISGGTTAIEHLHVKIDISKRVAILSDIAVATLKNRVAIKGSTNIVSEKLNNVQIGLLDNKGCAKFSQTIQGTFSKPVIKVDESMVTTVVNTVSSFFGKVANIGGTKKANGPCKVFYNGVVKQP